MFIIEIQINKVLGCEAARLTFSGPNRFAYIIQSVKQSPFSMAVKLIFSSMSFKGIHGGNVRIKFLIPKRNPVETRELDTEDDDKPCTSKQAKERELRRQQRQCKESKYAFHEITAQRAFHNAEKIRYSVDGGPEYWASVTEFQKKFNTNVDYGITGAAHIERVLSGDWLGWIKTSLTSVWSQNQTAADPFADFVKLYLKFNYKRNHIISKVTKCCLTVKAAMNVIEKAEMLKIFRDTSKIFDHITCNEYRVGFLIPISHQFINIEDITTESFDFVNLKTCIRLASSKDSVYIWENANHAVQCLLLVSLQLSMAFQCKQSLIYLQKLDTLQKHQAMQFVTAAYLQKHGHPNIKWTSKNYLQRIIDVCAQLGVTAIIEYPGALPVHPINAHVVKCLQAADSGIWNMEVVKIGQTCSGDQLLHCVEKNLK